MVSIAYKRNNMMSLSMIKEQPNRSLAKGLILLELFDYEQPEWGVRDLSRETGMDAATVYRLVKTLHNLGYLEQDPETQRYSLGPKIMQLASLYVHRNPLPIVGTKVFNLFSNRFEHNFYLATLRNYDVIYLAVLDGRGSIKVAVRAGGTTELHSTALGKILLAYQDDEFIQDFLIRRELEARTVRSITNPDELWRQIETIRRQGYSFNDGEQFEDIAAVGVPVRNRQDKVIAGVSLAFPRMLLSDGRLHIEALIPLAHEVANEIAMRSAEFLVSPNK
jgi:DNA-binding IclR family transcriptional regulator